MLVIAPRNMHLDIINYYRKDNPFFDIKVIDKTDLVAASSYSSRDDTVLYMMKEYQYSYDEAEKHHDRDRCEQIDTFTDGDDNIYYQRRSVPVFWRDIQPVVNGSSDRPPGQGRCPDQHIQEFSVFKG